MKRKILIALLAIVAVFACAFGFAACDLFEEGSNNSESGTENGNAPDSEIPSHTLHAWSQIYYPDGERHYRTCSGCEEKLYGDHEYLNGYCVYCGYGGVVLPHTHEWDGIYHEDGGRHYQMCLKCNEKLYGNHEYIGAYCEFCGRFENSKLLKYTLNDDGESYSVTGVNDASVAVIVVEEEYNGKPVTGIGDSAFSGCSWITSITLPDGVTSIGDSAFYYCSQLYNITLPDGVTSIGNSAFYYCSRLASITIPENVVSIGDGAFKECIRIKTINFNAVACNDFGSENKVFYDVCYGGSLTVNIGDNVTKIPAYFFNGNRWLKNLTIGEKVSLIGKNAFDYCSSLSAINFNATACADLNITPFYCAGQSGSGITVKIGVNVTKIPDKLFSPCSAIDISKVKDYPQYAPKITAVNFGTASKCKCESIGRMAFGFCSMLTSIVIPRSVTSVTSSAFGGCGLTKITVSPYNTVYTDENNCLLSKDGTILYVGCQNSAIPSSVTTIAMGAFSLSTSLTSIIIPDSVKSIGDYAFECCISLESVIIGDGVSSLGGGVFQDCTTLKSLTIGSGVTKIGNALRGCSSLESLAVASGNTKYNSVGNCIIETESKTLIVGCKNSLIPTDGCVTTIGALAFADILLTSITIPDSVTSIGQAAFHSCSSLTDINFEGTKEQWDAISKVSGWNFLTGNYTVHCTDGDVPKY